MEGDEIAIITDETEIQQPRADSLGNDDDNYSFYSAPSTSQQSLAQSPRSESDGPSEISTIAPSFKLTMTAVFKPVREWLSKNIPVVAKNTDGAEPKAEETQPVVEDGIASSISGQEDVPVIPPMEDKEDDIASTFSTEEDDPAVSPIDPLIPPSGAREPAERAAPVDAPTLDDVGQPDESEASNGEIVDGQRQDEAAEADPTRNPVPGPVADPADLPVAGGPTERQDHRGSHERGRRVLPAAANAEDAVAAHATNPPVADPTDRAAAPATISPAATPIVQRFDLVVRRIVRKILNPNGSANYRVKWRGYESSTYEHASSSCRIACIQQYEQALAEEEAARAASRWGIVDQQPARADAGTPLDYPDLGPEMAEPDQGASAEDIIGDDGNAAEDDEMEAGMEDEGEEVDDDEDDEANEVQQWVIEGILGKRVNNGVVEYEIKWEAPYESTWEPVKLLKCPDLIAEYEQRQGEKTRGKKRRCSNVHGSAGDAGPCPKKTRLEETIARYPGVRLKTATLSSLRAFLYKMKAEYGDACSSRRAETAISEHVSYFLTHCITSGYSNFPRVFDFTQSHLIPEMSRTIANRKECLLYAIEIFCGKIYNLSLLTEHVRELRNQAATGAHLETGERIRYLESIKLIKDQLPKPSSPCKKKKAPVAE